MTRGDVGVVLLEDDPDVVTALGGHLADPFPGGIRRALAVPAAASAKKTGADVNAYFPSATTIHVGDSVKFVPTGFHTVDLPKKGGTGLDCLIHAFMKATVTVQ